MSLLEANESAADLSEGAVRASSPSPKLNPAVHVIAAGAAVAAAIFSTAAPTGTDWWDLILRGVTAAAFTVAIAVTPWLASAASAMVAVLFAGSTWPLVAGVGGFVCSLGGRLARLRNEENNPVIGAVAGALTVQGLLGLGSFGFFGLPSIVAGAAIALPVILALPAISRRSRQLLGLGIAIVLSLIGIALLIAALTIVPVRTNANAGVQAAREGLQAARQGETAELTQKLEQAESELAKASSALGAAQLAPLRLIPVVAQHHRAVSAAAEQGAVVAGQAASIARDADVEQLRLRQGQFDLDLLASMAPQLQSASLHLEAALKSIEANRSDWLIPPIDDPLSELVAEIEDVLPEVRVGAAAAEVMPDMLGAEAERRYLVLFGSPGESREFGGFVGGYALLGVDDGDLSLIEAGSSNELIERANAGSLDHPDGYPDEYINTDPVTFPQNLTASPNISLIARAARDIFPELAGAPLDGVIYADPYALADMIRLTGPIRVEGVQGRLNSQALIDFIFDGQYRLFESREARFDAIAGLAGATAAGLAGADLPGPERLGNVLGPAARAGRLQVATFDDAENAFLASVQLQRDFSIPRGVDSMAVIQTNGTASKLDLYLHREIDYQVSIDDDGQLAAVVEVTLRSIMPEGIAPLTLGETDGTNRVLLSLYSPHELVEVTLDGRPHPVVEHREFGFRRHALFGIPLAPNAEATVRFVLQGTAPDPNYRLAVWSQPLVNDDVVRVTYDEYGQNGGTVTHELVENWLFEPDF